MASITDKFGKASIDTNYAVATTVKNTRTIGATVLEAYDLSKFSDDTPVFVVTYKKTTDPVSNEVSISNLVSWKALVNTGANTLTNLTLAPGYTDSGNVEDDFIECIPTSYWLNEFVDGILASHNPDGTLKDDAASPKQWVNPYCFRISRSSAQLIPNMVSEKIEFNQVDYDINNDYDEATNYVYTVPVDGVYEFGLQLRYDSLADQDLQYLYIVVNGSAEAVSVVQQGGVSESSIGLQDQLKLVAGDEVYFATYHTYGSSRNTRGTESDKYVYAWGKLIHAT